MHFIRFTKRFESFRLWDPEIKSIFTSRDVVFDKESMLQGRSETEDKEKGEAPDSLADTQVKGIEFSDGLKRPDRELLRFRCGRA